MKKKQIIFLLSTVFLLTIGSLIFACKKEEQLKPEEGGLGKPINWNVEELISQFPKNEVVRMNRAFYTFEDERDREQMKKYDLSPVSHNDLSPNFRLDIFYGGEEKRLYTNINGGNWYPIQEDGSELRVYEDNDYTTLLITLVRYERGVKPKEMPAKIQDNPYIQRNVVYLPDYQLDVVDRKTQEKMKYRTQGPIFNNFRIAF